MPVANVDKGVAACSGTTARTRASDLKDESMQLRSQALAAALSCAFATAIVSGQIRDRTTGQPMPDIRVTIGSRRTSTDAGGRYSLRGIPSGTQTLVVQSNDVPRQTFQVDVNAPSTRFDARVCSMTLDYSCSGLNGSPNSD